MYSNPTSILLFSPECLSLDVARIFSEQVMFGRVFRRRFLSFRCNFDSTLDYIKGGTSVLEIVCEYVAIPQVKFAVASSAKQMLEDTGAIYHSCLMTKDPKFQMLKSLKNNFNMVPLASIP